jgi:hypothetical protein
MKIIIHLDDVDLFDKDDKNGYYEENIAYGIDYNKLRGYYYKKYNFEIY